MVFGSSCFEVAASAEEDGEEELDLLDFLAGAMVSSRVARLKVEKVNGIALQMRSTQSTCLCENGCRCNELVSKM